MKPSFKQTEVGAIPEDWDVKSLEQVCDPQHPICYGIVQVRAHSDNGIPVLAIKNLNGDYSSNIHRCTPLVEQPYIRSRVCSGDILISIKGTIGRIGLVPSNFKGNISRDLARLRLTTQNVPLFWHQMLQSDWAQRRLQTATVGTTRMELSIAPLKKVLMPQPPFDNQHNIAEALGDADALIESLERLIAKKRDVKQGAMQELLTARRRLPGFTGKWATKTLGEIGDISGSGVDKKCRPNEIPVRLVNYMDAARRDFIYNQDLNHWVTATPAQARRCAVQKGDIFFTPSSETREGIGLAAVAMEDIPNATYSYHIVRLRLRADWDLRFRTYAFKTRDFMSQTETYCDGCGTRYVLSQAKFRKLTISVPADKAEQTAIAAVLSDMDAELAALEAKLSKARAIKQGMMQELLTGRIRLK